MLSRTSMSYFIHFYAKYGNFSAIYLQYCLCTIRFLLTYIFTYTSKPTPKNQFLPKNILTSTVRIFYCTANLTDDAITHFPLFDETLPLPLSFAIAHHSNTAKSAKTFLTVTVYRCRYMYKTSLL